MSVDNLFVQVLATAYHNLAAECEFLKEWPDSLLNYQKSLKVCQKYLGPFSDITKMFESKFIKAKENIQKHRE
jgi:hypothetical protein